MCWCAHGSPSKSSVMLQFSAMSTASSGSSTTSSPSFMSAAATNARPVSGRISMAHLGNRNRSRLHQDKISEKSSAPAGVQPMGVVVAVAEAMAGGVEAVGGGGMPRVVHCPCSGRLVRLWLAKPM